MRCLKKIIILSPFGLYLKMKSCKEMMLATKFLNSYFYSNIPEIYIRLVGFERYNSPIKPYFRSSGLSFSSAKIWSQTFSVGSFINNKLPRFRFSWTWSFRQPERSVSTSPPTSLKLTIDITIDSILLMRGRMVSLSSLSTPNFRFYRSQIYSLVSLFLKANLNLPDGSVKENCRFK